MPRLLALAVLLALGACGQEQRASGGEGLIPLADSERLVATAARIAEQTRDGECAQARGSADRLQRQVRRLERVNPELEANLRAWAEYLAGRTRIDCEEELPEVPTDSVPTETEPPPTETEPPPVETEPPPAETQPPPAETQPPPAGTQPPAQTQPPAGTPPSGEEGGTGAPQP